jgi:hypothetical protein
VSEGHGLTHLLDHGQQARQAFRPVGFVAEQLGEGAATDQFHGVAGLAIGELTEVMHGHDAGVLQRAGQSCLAEETLYSASIAAQLNSQDLDGQITLEGVIATAIDLAHAADADPLEEHTAGCVQRLCRFGVRRERLASDRIR